MLQALQNYAMLFVIVAVTLLPAFAIAMTTAGSIKTWYAELKKPWWNPPNWIFGPVWTVLYLCMSVAAWLVWLKAPQSTALKLYVFQLLLNHVWSPVFFLLKKPGWAFALILTMWGAILATLLGFWMIDPRAGQLMSPYLLWVSYAGCLNYRIWKDNAGRTSKPVCSRVS